MSQEMSFDNFIKTLYMDEITYILAWRFKLQKHIIFFK
jgi:hypothetical protein